MFGYKFNALQLALLVASMIMSVNANDLEDAAAAAATGLLIVWILIPVCIVCCIVIGIWACCTGCWGKCRNDATTVVVAGGAQPAQAAVV